MHNCSAHLKIKVKKNVLTLFITLFSMAKQKHSYFNLVKKFWMVCKCVLIPSESMQDTVFSHKS